MAAQDTLTFDLVPPRRPTLDDVGGGQKENAAGLPPPDPRTCPSAEEWNQISKQVVASGRVEAVCQLSLAYDTSSANYYITMVSAAGDDVVSGTFTMVRNAAGDCSITWPVDTFPSAARQPGASINGTHPALSCASLISNGVRVLMASAGGGYDVPFSVEIF
jgi:hypothetical protein